MKSFKQYITESSVLVDLIDEHDDPFSFLAAAMDAMMDGTLKLKTRGMANARELIAAWNKKKKRKIKLGEAVEYIKEVIKVPIKVGDTVLGGKFKNKRIVVKSIGKNEKGDITINGRPLLKYRILDEQWGAEEDFLPGNLLQSVRDGSLTFQEYLDIISPIPFSQRTLRTNGKTFTNYDPVTGKPWGEEDDEDDGGTDVGDGINVIFPPAGNQNQIRRDWRNWNRAGGIGPEPERPTWD